MPATTNPPIDNEENCGAWAEFQRSPGTHLVFINAGIEVGAGILMHGRIHPGRDGIAGEVGHTTISARGLWCACDNCGCGE